MWPGYFIIVFLVQFGRVLGPLEYLEASVALLGGLELVVLAAAVAILFALFVSN
jgi:hypothetical protein